MTGTWQARLCRAGRGRFDAFSSGEGSRSRSMAALERLPWPLDFKGRAEQREQTSDQDHSTLDRQQEVDARIKFGKTPEDDDAEQRAAENETETAEKKYM